MLIISESSQGEQSGDVAEGSICDLSFNSYEFDVDEYGDSQFFLLFLIVHCDEYILCAPFDAINLIIKVFLIERSKRI